MDMAARLLRELAKAGRVQGARAAGVSGVAARRGASWRWGLLSAGGLAAVTSVVAAPPGPALCDDGDNVVARAGWPGVLAAGAAAAAAAWWGLTPRSAASAQADLLGWQKKWEIGQVPLYRTSAPPRRSLACTH